MCENCGCYRIPNIVCAQFEMGLEVEATGGGGVYGTVDGVDDGCDARSSTGTGTAGVIGMFFV